MPRKLRMYLPGMPSHVVHRGNNRNPCFRSPQDYETYLKCLEDACRRRGVAVHAWVLMTNHVHLLMTPATETGISDVMQSVGRRYVYYFNKTHGRTGTLWEGRHSGSLVASERYLLACYRYIELNPVAARMVADPSAYRWSSYRCNALGERCAFVSPHDMYRALGADSRARLSAYRALCAIPVEKSVVKAIRTGIRFSMPAGDKAFVEQIERRLGRSIGQAKRGPPYRRVRADADQDDRDG